MTTKQVGRAATAASQKMLRFTRSGGSVWSVTVNRSKVSFVGNQGSKRVDPGEHTVQWFVKGAPGSKYSFAGTAPPEAKFRTEATFGPQGKDMGSAWVTVN